MWNCRSGHNSISGVAAEPMIRHHFAMIHILFSSAAGTLGQLLMDRGQADRIAYFSDTLDWGPIQSGSFLEREEWFDKFAPVEFGKYDWLDEGASSFRRTVRADPDRLIWISPRCQQELAGLFWFLAEFGGEGAQMIVADYPLHGTWRDEPPLRLSELQEDQIAELLDGCQRRAWDPSEYPEGRWSTLMAENSCLRIVEGSGLRSVDADYFDHFLVAQCPTDWTKAHRLVGDVMGTIWNTGHSPDPAFLYWRLRELIQSSTIASDGELPMFGDPKNAPNVRLLR